MQKIVEWFSQFYNVPLLVQTIGYGGMALIIFVETGLLFGFFLPGDSLLFTAGLACAPDNALGVKFDLLTLNLILVPAAIIGDTVGYWIGRKAGEKLYHREKTLFFRKDHLMHTKAFYEKHGGKTIIIARFVPLIRTFAPVVAGIAQMPYKDFLYYNVFGGFGWVTGLSVLGYFLGQVEWIRKNLEMTIMLIIIVSLLPAIITFIKAKYFDAPIVPEGENAV
jgi:membrane-associated protein